MKYSPAYVIKIYSRKGAALIVLRRIKTWILKTARTLLLFGIGFLQVYPILYMVNIALRPYSQMIDPSVIWIPRELTLENIKNTIEVMNYYKTFIYSIVLCTVSTLLTVFSCALAGYGFARFKFKERNLLFALLLFSLIVPIQTIAVPSYLNFKYFDFGGVLKLFSLVFGTPPAVNLLNTQAVFYLPAAFGWGIRGSLYIFVYRQFFRSFPKELEEAAYIDGCGPFKTFVRILAPSSAPAFLTVGLFSIVWYWNDYFYSSMFLGSNLTMSMALSQIRSLLNKANTVNVYDPFQAAPMLFAGAFMTILPPFLIYLFAQKYFIQSIERTGIVG